MAVAKSQKIEIENVKSPGGFAASMNSKTCQVQCHCGQVMMKAVGAPIMAVACYCHSCQEAARRLESLSDAPPISEPDGGTHFVMQRKDRLEVTHGAELLREHRLTPKSSTRRVVAACCNSAMFLEFQGGHWLSIYMTRFDTADRPPIEMRTMTQDRRSDVAFADTIPSPKTHTLGFMWKLMKAWAAMGFQAPKIEYVRGSIDA